MEEGFGVQICCAAGSQHPGHRAGTSSGIGGCAAVGQSGGVEIGDARRFWGGENSGLGLGSRARLRGGLQGVGRGQGRGAPGGNACATG